MTASIQSVADEIRKHGKANVRGFGTFKRVVYRKRGSRIKFVPSKHKKTIETLTSTT